MSFISDAFKSVSNLNVFTAQLDMLEKMLPQLMEQFQSINIVADIISDAIQLVGDMLGIDQSIIDLAQGAFRAYLGDIPGAMMELMEAMEHYEQNHGDSNTPRSPDRNIIFGSVLAKEDDSYKKVIQDLPLSDRQQFEAHYEEVTHIVVNLLMDIYEKILTDQQKRMDREIGGTEGSGGKDGAKGTKNFFQLMAEILGQILGDKAADMMESMERLKTAGGQKVDPNAYGESIDDQQKFKTETDNQAHAFSIAQTDYQAETQMYSMLQNVVNTSLKTVGESMTTLAKRQ